MIRNFLDFNYFSQLNKKAKWNKIVHSNLVFNYFGI